MDQGAKLWVYKTARKNLWRVSGHIGMEDLLQDGMMFWHRIGIKYPNVTHLPHKMALFKTAFTNHIHDLSKNKSKIDFVTESDMDVTLDTLVEQEDPAQDPDLGFVIAQLPPAIMRVLERFHKSDPPYRLRLDGTRETDNERACRIAGVDPTRRNIRDAVLEYLRGTKLHPQYD
jgi:hypothetical protein